MGGRICYTSLSLVSSTGVKKNSGTATCTYNLKAGKAEKGWYLRLGDSQPRLTSNPGIVRLKTGCVAPED